MLKNNKGITLMTLIVTIVVMIILISIVGYFSMDSVINSHIANDKKEFADIVQYVATRKAELLIDEFDVSEKYPNSVVTAEALYLFARGLGEDELNKIIEVNEAENLSNNYKYIYITSENLNNESISSENIVIKDAKNNYIINFFTGTVIGLYENGEKVETSGSIKSLNEILDAIL